MIQSATETKFPTASVHLPCAESCTAFQPINPNGWSDYGICTNRQSPRCGYPVRPGNDCSYYQVSSDRKSAS